jgi:hypothetical protein
MSSSLEAISYHTPVAVTQSDTTKDPNGPFHGFIVGVSGDVKITGTDGATGVLPSCQAGTIYPVPFTRMWSTGTTASGTLVGLKGFVFGVPSTQ